VSPGRSTRDKRSLRRRAATLAGLATFGEIAAVRRRTGRLGGRLIVRCRDGHLFCTLWIPGASVTALRLGPWRVQWCPVGRHVTVVTPVDERELSPEQRADARAHPDIGLP